MIELENVTRSFRASPGLRQEAERVVALRNVDLRVPAGGLTAVVGPNGAGKSTLFALALGFLRPTEGRITVAGTDPRTYVRRRGASYLPDRLALPGDWRVRGGLRALARLEGAGSSRRAVDRALERLGLEDHAGKRISELSRGLLQRVGLAQALLVEHELMVFDEPTQGLDPLWRIRVRDLVAELRGSGRTILLASHDLSEVELLADRAMVLDDGSVRGIIELREQDASGADEDEGKADPAATGYRIRLVRPAAVMDDVFPDARLLEPDDIGERGPAGGRTATYDIEVGTAEDLNRRLEAILAAGALLASVEPRSGEGLEARVRRTLEGEPRVENDE